MFIIFEKLTKRIHAEGRGNPTESDNKLYLGSDVICNDLNTCCWKYIADQRLETDESIGYLHDADYYETYDLAPTDHELLMAIAEILEAELS